MPVQGALTGEVHMGVQPYRPAGPPKNTPCTPQIIHSPQFGFCPFTSTWLLQYFSLPQTHLAYSSLSYLNLSSAQTHPPSLLLDISLGLSHWQSCHSKSKPPTPTTSPRRQMMCTQNTDDGSAQMSFNESVPLHQPLGNCTNYFL